MPVRYDQDTTAKAIRLVREHAGDYPSEHAAITTASRPAAGVKPGDTSIRGAPNHDLTWVRSRTGRCRAALVLIRPAAQRPVGTGFSVARSARSAAAVMLRSIPPNTTPWNGDMDRQYACPASPRGWKIARWL